VSPFKVNEVHFCYRYVLCERTPEHLFKMSDWKLYYFFPPVPRQLSVVKFYFKLTTQILQYPKMILSQLTLGPLSQ